MKIELNIYLFFEPGKRILKYTTAGFTAFKKCKSEADMKIALNIYLFLNWANVFLKYAADLFTACNT
ncbi:MAG: hypothetical protein LBH44_07190 [Treponema sp.]|nr:hypothetical protein [Treponema sp.]